ncbi:hypothetical protein TNCV_473001 [Trichonephila clavipes]|nr:hypothetical protein TNCV_473001 [Trichonephila clavipes]
MFNAVGILYYFLEFFGGGRKLEHPVTKLLVVPAIVGFSDTWSAAEIKKTDDDKKVMEDYEDGEEELDPLRLDKNMQDPAFEQIRETISSNIYQL